MSGQLSYDSFFGVYPSLTVGHSLDSLLDLSAYATYYPSSAFEGVETGVNLQVSSRQRNLTLTPGIGLVSGSVFVEGRPFALAEGYVVSLGIQFEQKNWYTQGFWEYYGALKRKSIDTYDFGLFSVQAGRIITPSLRIGFMFGQLGTIRRERNSGNADTFTVSRLGISTSFSLPFAFMAELASGLAWGDSPPVFYQISLHRTLGKP